MYLVKAQNQKTNQVEIYYCSDSVPLEEFKESLNWIKDGWKRNWERVNREIIEVQKNVIPSILKIKEFSKISNTQFYLFSTWVMKFKFPVEACFSKFIITNDGNDFESKFCFNSFQHCQSSYSSHIFFGFQR